jgi:hypothetical protein
MKRILTGLVALVLVGGMLLVAAPVAWSAEVAGKVKSVDPAGKMITLEDGTQLTIPGTIKVSKDQLKAGATVKATYEDMGGQKVVKSLQVQPATKN